ncbi:MAG: leucine dehydrogenase [Bradymonadia bacterium]|jgi:leucine dehydrogenase
MKNGRLGGLFSFLLRHVDDALRRNHRLHGGFFARRRVTRRTVSARDFDSANEYALDLFNYMSELRYGELHLAHDAATGLRAIVAIHNTNLGPGIGGCRAIRYPNSDAGIRDAMRLSRGMAYKAAAAGLPHGGAKAVIMIPEGDFDRTALFLKYGEFVDSLNGKYVTCEDSGTSTDDMDVVSTRTNHVLGTNGGSGDPSPFTALGCRRGVQAAVKFQLGRDDLEGLHVAIQGVGHVGYYLARELHDLGASLTIADVNPSNADRAAADFGAAIVPPEEILFVACDVLAPCALGAVFNDETIPQLKTTIIAGASNNVLAEDRHGLALHKAGVLYAPDYVINAGGLINVATEFTGYDEAVSTAKVCEIYDTLLEIFERSRKTDTPTQVVADTLAEERMYASV